MDHGAAGTATTHDLSRWLLGKHIEPHIGGVPVGKLSTRLIRGWRAALLANGVSVSVVAKAYRLLRAVMTTAVEDDKILSHNPCRIRGAGKEDADERPVLTVAQVFELAEQVGRRPNGNIRSVTDGYRLRFRRHGEMRTSPELYGTNTPGRTDYKRFTRLLRVRRNLAALLPDGQTNGRSWSSWPLAPR